MQKSSNFKKNDGYGLKLKQNRPFTKAQVFHDLSYSLFFVSIIIVTGPLFNKHTFMSAPNVPV